MSRTVLVTGANSDIGSATVRALLDGGATVVATVRDRAGERTVEELRTGAPVGDRLVIDRLEVTDADQCDEVMRRHRPDVVVNNAGAALLGAVVDIDDDDARRQLEVMVVGPIRLGRLLADAAGDPAGRRLVNISSSLTGTPMPFTGWYAAAKAAMEVLSERMRTELAPSGVHVAVVQCGAVATAAWDDAATTVTDSNDDATSEGRARWASLTGALDDRFTDPADIGGAVAAVALGEDDRAIVRVGFGSHLGLAARFVPTPLKDLANRVVFGLRRG